MPDQNTMSPEEFAKHADAEWAKTREGMTVAEGRPINLPPQGQRRMQPWDQQLASTGQIDQLSQVVEQKLFKCPACGNCQTGDGVCARCAFAGKESVVVQPSQGQFKPGQTVWRAVNGEKFNVIGIDKDFVGVRSPDSGNRDWLPRGWLTATEPNAEPLPQKCPHCGGDTEIGDGVGEFRYVRCKGKCRIHGPLKPNRLEAIQAWNSIRIEEKIESRVVLGPLLPGRESSVPADSEPLTEEWLERRGLTCAKPTMTLNTLLGFVDATKIHICISVTSIYLRLYSNVTISDARTLCRLLGVTIKE